MAGQRRGKGAARRELVSERVFGCEYDVWDVHTDKERWWVTSPTNFYSQN